MKRADRDWDRWVAMAAKEVAATIQGLPESLRGSASQLPVVYEPKPSRALLEDGIDPDTLGLFVGPNYVEESSGSVSLPAQILLFLENLWDFSEGDAAVFREEIRTTYVHELGHYLGLDEDELTERGLE